MLQCQRFFAAIPDSGPEIKNRCTQEGLNGEILASILKSGPEIKNRCTQEGLNVEKLASIPKSEPEIKNHCTLEDISGQNMQRFPSLGLKSGIAAAVGWRSAGGLFFFAAAKIRIGRGPRRRDGRCRRYHSPLRQRRLESDAENRCSREVVSVRNLLILKFIPLQSEMTTLFSCLTSKAPDCELAIWGLDNNQR